MRIYIHCKQLKKRTASVTDCLWEWEKDPATLRELLTLLVTASVESYNKRIRTTSRPGPVTEETMDTMAVIGKVSFGMPFGTREADGLKAIETAIQGFEDGLFRIFVNDREIEQLDVPLALADGDAITILRLVMLTGGFF